MTRFSLPLFSTASLAVLLALTPILPLQATDLVLKSDLPRLATPARATETTEVLFTVRAKNSVGKNGMTAARFAATNRLKLARALTSDKQVGVLKFGSIKLARKAIAKLRKDTRIQSVSFNRYLPHVLHAFVPNDPYFADQWHLGNANAPLVGASVAGPWAKDITGAGVIIGIVDEGVEKAHEDIAANFDALNSYDFAGNDTDPSPEGTGDVEDHGTSVAGVAAGVGGNGIGITGAAPFAKIAGLKITFDGQSTLADFIDAVKYHSTGANRQIKIKNHSYGFSFPFIEDNEETAAFSESAAAGTIHTVSAGNDRFPYGSNIDGTASGDIAEDSNKSSLSNNPDVITVAALASDGIFADYSSLGSNIFVTAPSSSFRTGELSIYTTDRTGADGYNSVADDSDYDSFPDLNYTSTFGGTSSAAPLVAGIMALAKQVNPALNVRLAKHLLASTSIKVDPSNPTWVTNAAGYHFSTDYGFGLIDANALVNAAKSITVSPLQTRTTASITVNKLVPEDSTISQLIPVGQTGNIEEIQIRLVVNAGYEGDLEATITSPSGTTSTFCHASAYDSSSGRLDWTFTTNAFWGEQGIGNWTVTLADRGKGDALTWNSVQLKVRSDTAVGSVAPFNDAFNGAFPLTGKVFTHTEAVDLATGEDGEPDRRTITPNHSVWFTWTAPVAGRLSVNTSGSDSDTIMAAYTGTNLENLEEVTINDNQSGSDKTSNVYLTVTKGAKYFFAVDVATGAAKTVKLNGRLKACGE